MKYTNSASSFKSDFYLKCSFIGELTTLYLHVNLYLFLLQNICDFCASYTEAGVTGIFVLQCSYNLFPNDSRLAVKLKLTVVFSLLL